MATWLSLAGLFLGGGRGRTGTWVSICEPAGGGVDAGGQLRALPSPLTCSIRPWLSFPASLNIDCLKCPGFF